MEINTTNVAAEAITAPALAYPICLWDFFPVLLKPVLEGHRLRPCTGELRRSRRHRLLSLGNRLSLRCECPLYQVEESWRTVGQTFLGSH
jgi:hypothetical protein